MHPHISLPFPDSDVFERISYAVSGMDVLVASQGSNLDMEKAEILWRQAVSLWSAVAPISFEPARSGEQPLLTLKFVQDGTTSELGATSSFITRLPTGASSGSASIEMKCDNQFFVDAFREHRRLATQPLFDLVTATAHEVGHALGLDHPPLDPQTQQETEPCIMSRNVGDSVKRQLFPYDIREVQRLHGVLHAAQPVLVTFQQGADLVDSAPGVTLQSAGSETIIGGPVGAFALYQVLVPAKGRWVNAVRVKFRTVSRNVFVNRIVVFHGIELLQSFAVSSRADDNEGLAGKMFDLQLGFLRRPVATKDMLVRFEVYFSDGGDRGVDGVIIFESVELETLPLPLVSTSGSLLEVVSQ